MLDTLTSLAFSMHSNKGVYALLLGSGISRSAQIPTGWEITLDLVRKVATLQGEGERCSADPAAWYTDKFGREPDYADLLGMLGKTPDERQRLVQYYIEPTPEQREQGQKIPTPAHRAIARLVARGYIRVLITTNFDRLLEIALQDEGIHPTVVSTADHVRGAIPLTHAKCTVIKVHGDYLDIRIKNTSAELSAYDDAMNVLLDRVFDEFGLLVCGWSADWDVALKAAIERAPSRRFSMYWAAHGNPGVAAQGLIERRGAQVLSIRGADRFFEELAEKVAALESLNQPHPLSAPMAVAMLKEYLPEPRHRIRLHDLINRELERTLKILIEGDFQLQHFNPEILTGQVKRYEAASEILVHMAYAAGRWATLEQTAQWRDIIVMLANRAASVGGVVQLIGLRRYPAALILHAFAMGAVVAGNYAQLGLLTAATFKYSLTEQAHLGDGLNANKFTYSSQSLFGNTHGYDGRKFAASERIADVLRAATQHDLLDDDSFARAHAKVELVFAAGHAERVAGDRSGEDFFSPIGCCALKPEIRSKIMQEWKTEVQALQTEAPICIMASLKKLPRLDEIEAYAQKQAYY